MKTYNISTYAPYEYRIPEKDTVSFQELYQYVATDYKVKCKDGLGSISPSSYPPSLTRSNTNSPILSFWALDFDNEVEPGKMIKPDKMHSYLSNLGLSHIIYTTFSNTREKPKFRVFVPLSQAVPGDLWNLTVREMLKQTHLSFCDKQIDTKALYDTARLYYVSSSNRLPLLSYYFEGRELEVDLVALSKEREAEKAAEAERKEQMLQSIKLREERNRRLGIIKKVIDPISYWEAHSWWVDKAEKYGDGLKVKCECPYHHEHTNGEKYDGALFKNANGFWTFYCLHDHHGRKISLKDILK